MALIYTNTKSRVKPKRKSQKELAEYAAWCAKYGIDPTGKKARKQRTFTPLTIDKSTYRRETRDIPSLNSYTKGATTWSNERKVYTGDKMIGIAAMHKSNLVPIFAEEAAIEISQMRRS